MSFTFGPEWARDTGCCGKPVGCTNMSPACLMRGHPWKRRHVQAGAPDHLVTTEAEGASMTPSIGRIVHYVSYGTPGGEYRSECRAAVVTEVDPIHQLDGSQSVGLCVLNPEGMFFNRGVLYHEGDTGHDHAGAEIPAKSYPGGTWHWPERVDG